MKDHCFVNVATIIPDADPADFCVPLPEDDRMLDELLDLDFTSEPKDRNIEYKKQANTFDMRNLKQNIVKIVDKTKPPRGS